MKKSTLFISVILSTFVLAMLAGVLTAYRNFSSSSSLSSNLPNTSVAQATTDLATVTAQRAASAAAQYLNRSDLYSMETADLNGATAYKVTLSSGDVVYISTQGQMVLYVPATTLNIQSAQQNAPSVQTAPSFKEEQEVGEHD
jgi:hypothetical protein